jgi:hypothetical protein
MSKVSNIVKLTKHEYWLDWYHDEEIEINLDDYVFFECEYRLDTWYLIGHKCNKETYTWSEEELSGHWSYPNEIAKFIYEANKYVRTNPTKRQGCKVSRFNNLHYSGSFYKALQELFDMVAQMEEAEATKEQGDRE